MHALAKHILDLGEDLGVEGRERARERESERARDKERAHARERESSSLCLHFVVVHTAGDSPCISWVRVRREHTQVLAVLPDYANF
jgi:hypothetical protein